MKFTLLLTLFCASVMAEWVDFAHHANIWLLRGLFGVVAGSAVLIINEMFPKE